jgi:hypothetical protein
MRLSEFIDSVMQDIQYAARGFVRRPAFTAVSGAHTRYRRGSDDRDLQLAKT